MWRFTYSIQKACVSITVFISKDVYLEFTYCYHRHQIILSYAKNNMEQKKVLFTSVLQLVLKNFQIK